MRTADIKQRWLDYFSAREHAVVPSASLVSADPSLLFTVAGMVPFIPYMLGQRTPPWNRATSVQKCIRTNDIEEVGKTTRHGTFFQMNGNFSFGDYFKAGAIEYAWELVTGAQSDGHLGFNPDDIWVTVYHDDQEAYDLWRKIAGIPEARIQRRGLEDNYWDTGQAGPAGYCSEIYVDRGPNYGREGGPEADEDRYLEIWNLVFMQYERGPADANGNFELLGELQQKNIDTGMGLERVAFLLQGVDNIYETDEVYPVIGRTEELTGRKYGRDAQDDVRMRVVADHVRSAMMLIGDGVRPANEGRGYVLRRLLRRAIYELRLLGLHERVLPELLPVSKNAMAASYPELETDFAQISQVAYTEEENFLSTLASGTKILDLAIDKTQKSVSRTLSGSQAFELHDTYGFPLELTLQIAENHDLQVDQDEFTRLMGEQKARARAAALAKRTGSVDISAYQDLKKALSAPPTFVGYKDLVASGKVLALLSHGAQVPAVTQAGEVEVILDHTPFYAESGGQLADQGILELPSGGIIEVDDVQRPIAGLIVHRGRLMSGTIALNDEVIARVDQQRRHSIAKAHTATHMVHKALHEELGEQATQAGSENAPFRFRFDFHNPQAVDKGALTAIEARVNTLLVDNLEVADQQMKLDDAVASGAMALFGEKYGEDVRVVSIGDTWSRELCGGTHVEQTGELGLVTILSEASIGSGVRRIDALVGTQAYEQAAKERALVSQINTMLKSSTPEIPDRIDALMAKLKAAEKQVAELKSRELMASVGKFLDEVDSLPGLDLIQLDLPDYDSEQLKTLVLELRNRLASKAAVVLLYGRSGERVVVAAGATAQATAAGVKAGGLVSTVSKMLGGGGGGKPDYAQGGGTKPELISEAMAAVRQELTQV